MNTTINQDAINKAVWGACDTFRGVVDPSIYKDYVLTMLFLKYLSDVWQDDKEQYEAEYGNEPELIAEMMKNERFVLPESANFYTVYEARFEPGNGERIDKALHAIEEANIAKLRDVFQDISFNSNKLGEDKQKNDILRHLLEDFAKDTLNLRPSRIGTLDIIGNAYEFLIKNFASTSGKKAGEFYTPPEVSELISRLVEPEEGDEICDPACGSGSLLMKCGNQIKQRFEGSKRYALFGQEAIGSTWALAKMNMFLHGEDNHRIEWGDTIRNPKLLDGEGKLKHFDVIVANPPFSLDKWGHESAEHDPYGRFRRGVPPRTKGDYAFILHMIETMKPGSGRMGVVVPHGVLFRGAAEGKIRTKLIEENLLDVVIGLPEKLFYGTGIPAAILIFKKNKSRQCTTTTDGGSDGIAGASPTTTDGGSDGIAGASPTTTDGGSDGIAGANSVLFIDASREYKNGKNQNFLIEDHLRKIIETYNARESVDKYAYLASLDEIKENDFNLNIPRYVDTFEEEEEIDLMAVLKEREQLKAQLSDLEVEMAGYLKELGYE